MNNFVKRTIVCSSAIVLFPYLAAYGLCRKNGGVK